MGGPVVAAFNAYGQRQESIDHVCKALDNAVARVL
jgi:hypothetical protein